VFGVQVSPPRVGEKHPASVLAEVVVDTRGMRGDVASGWDELKQHDVLFLMGGERTASLPACSS
jgi:intron-binding protein aquarius